MKIPEHFKVAFDWIDKPKSNTKVRSPNTVWLEKEITYLIFNPPEEPPEAQDDYRHMLIKSLEHEKCFEGAQVSYIRDVVKCLAKAVIATPLPNERKVWLGEVNKQTKKLALILKEKPNSKSELPLNWKSLFALNIEAINDSQIESSKLTEISSALRTANMFQDYLKGKQDAHGILDLVAVLNLLNKQSKMLSEMSAIKFYKFPQTFFKEISNNKTLFLAYQRSAIQAISAVNQKSLGATHDAVTAHVLSCVFHKEITKQSVVNNRKQAAI